MAVPKVEFKDTDSHPDCDYIPLDLSGLLRAILVRAILDYTGVFSDVSKKEACSSISWFDKDEPLRPFSFSWVCEHLDIDPSYIRQRIKRIRAKTKESGPVQRVARNRRGY